MPRVRVDRDDIQITQSCVLEFAGPVVDANGDGVLHVSAPNVVVDLGGGVFNGSPDGTPPDQFKGVGIRATAPGLVLRNGAIRGFKTAIHATGVQTALFERLNLSDNYGQRLKSTPLAEDGGDWLWPHANDGNEWLANYGAALYLEDCQGVVVRRVKAWHGQNGIVLDRVTGAQIYDNDCSFLSGWGVAMWRSSDNTICRNALDFCVRGYSHGVYNRGQDSAGILCFEQCNGNVIAFNSVTHGGDGFFGFGGKEALGEAPRPADASDGPGADGKSWHADRGCNKNIIYGNDFSHAVAHGIELTFSFDNLVLKNICMDDAICGLWGGYSQRTQIAGNRFMHCGSGAYGAERGGINIEHGTENYIVDNTFLGNAVGVFLWWDEDPGLMRTPWAAANKAASESNIVAGNTFVDSPLAIELRRCKNTAVSGNTFKGCVKELDADAESSASIRAKPPMTQDRVPDDLDKRMAALPGETKPVGARSALGGREAILMGPRGPYDWTSPRAEFERGVAALMSPVPEGVEVLTPWRVRAFATTKDPREDLPAFYDAAKKATVVEIPSLVLPFGGQGPSTLSIGGKPALGQVVAAAEIPADGFGLTAKASFKVDTGCWRVRVTSDDGVRVYLDGKTFIERWTWHAPTEDSATVTVDHPTTFELGVEYFELTGHAVLSVTWERCDPK
jgi:hypothetical protein